MILIFGLTLTLVSALTIDFFYSDSCGYCKAMKPIVEGHESTFPDYTFNWLNTIEKDNYNKYIKEGFKGVPAFIITTDDCREIKFTGANNGKLKCELNQMSTRGCETYSADSSIGGSWFIE